MEQALNIAQLQTANSSTVQHVTPTSSQPVLQRALSRELISAASHTEVTTQLVSKTVSIQARWLLLSMTDHTSTPKISWISWIGTMLKPPSSSPVTTWAKVKSTTAQQAIQNSSNACTHPATRSLLTPGHTRTLPRLRKRNSMIKFIIMKWLSETSWGSSPPIYAHHTLNATRSAPRGSLLSATMRPTLT